VGEEKWSMFRGRQGPAAQGNQVAAVVSILALGVWAWLKARAYFGPESDTALVVRVAAFVVAITAGLVATCRRR
jgi:Na+-transporting methylmalonyl-CoA/oxaloacetate decarboxylase beta subunit